GAPELRRVDFGGERRLRQHVAHWPRRGRRIGQRGRDADRREEYRVAAGLMNDAALVAVELGLAGDTVRDGQANELTLAVDLELRDRIDLRSEKIRRDMIARLGRVATRNEEGRAEDLRGAGDAPAVGVVRWETR